MAAPVIRDGPASGFQPGTGIPPISAEVILESINDAFYAVDGQWRLTYVNRQTEQLWGKKREALIGRSLWEAFPEAIGTFAYEQLHRAFRERETVRFETVSPVLQRWIEVSVYPTSDGISVYFRDISQRKEIEQELRRNRDEFATAIGRITDGFGTLDRDWRITFINQRADAIFRRMQRVPGDLIGRNMWEEFPGLVGSILYREYHRAAAEQIPVEFQIFYPPLDAWFEVNVYPSSDGLSVYFREITERKRAEAALHDSEERFRAVFDRTAIGLVQVDLDGRLLMTNDRYCAITGYSREELQGRTFLEISHADDIDRNRERFQQLLSGAVPAYEIEKRYVRPDGGEVWVHVTASLLRDTEGRPQSALGAVQDITEQRRAEEALRESESRYRFLVENTSDAVWRFDLVLPMPLTLSEDEQIEWGYRHVVLGQCNDGMARIYGYERAEQMTGLPLVAILPRSDLINVDFLRRFIRSGYRLIDDEAVTRASDGSERIVLCNFVGLVRDGRLLSVFGASRDVTQRRQAERALRESEERLRELNRTLERRIEERTRELRHSEDRLRALALELTRTEQRERRRLSLVLHDHVQQLLVGAQMHFGIAAQNAAAPEQQEPLRKGLEVIQEALRTCRSLAVELSPPLLHDQGLAPALAWLARRMRENYRLPVEFSADGSADVRGEELKELLFLASRELLLNVIKHANAGTARLRFRRDAARLICVEVEDDGVGFDPLADDVAARSRQSFGLFHIRERLLAVGGKLVLDSLPGRGTRVCLQVPESHIEMPAEPESAADQTLSAPAAAMPREPVGQPTGTIRVLLVDDHAMVREGLIAVLERQPDLRVVGEAVNGQQAVEVARDLEPDIVLMDVSLPGINGIAATQHITMTMPWVQVIGLSAHEEEAMGRAMVDAGAVRYLTKGGPSDELVETIRAVIRQRSPRTSA